MNAPQAGIIAAGDGSRLRTLYPGVVKPLVPIAGAPLCHWVVGSLRDAGIAGVTLLHNSRGRDVASSLTKAFPALAWRFLERDTASSWESFRLVCSVLAESADSFLISTIDALMPPAEVARFLAEARQAAEPAMALTDFVDDEKPLWADVGCDGRLTGLGSAARSRRWVTAGFYHMTAAEARRMPPADAFPSLRGYWSGLLAAGTPVRGIAVSKTLDIDRPEDVAAAEAFVHSL